MWLVNFLPVWFFYVLIIGGTVGIAASYVLKQIPFIGSNALAVRVGSLIAFLFGIWFHGALCNNDAWVERVKELEAKVAAAEAQSKEANAALDNKTTQKTQAIKARQTDIIRYVDAEIIKYDTQCAIPAEFIAVHNRAAEQPK